MSIKEEEAQVRQELIICAKSLFERGYTGGSSGNISVQLSDGSIIATPTNSCFGLLNSERLSKVAIDGQLISGDKPTKELPMHQAFYQKRTHCRAVIHLHSNYLTALSCLSGLNKENCLPVITPYFVMKVGTLPLLPYFKPGSQAIADSVSQYAPTHKAVLLANHGPVVSGSSLMEAMFNIEELENTAKVYFLIKSHPFCEIAADDIANLTVAP